jgi:hypothetical protein
MMEDTPGTLESSGKFDFSSFPEDTLFHERREKLERRKSFGPKTDASSLTPRVPKERRARKERRRRIDPTTFEKQYTEAELEFMNAMQQFKVQSCKTFPTHREVLEVAMALGYRKVVPTEDADEPSSEPVTGGDKTSRECDPVNLSVSMVNGSIP